MKRKVFADCLRKNHIAIILFLLVTVLNTAVFALYGIMAEPFVYADILVGVIFLILLAVDYMKELKSARHREKAINNILLNDFDIGEDTTLRDRDYAEMISSLRAEVSRISTEVSLRKQADDDYYTSWVHQIKTPIAVMKLSLTEDTLENRALFGELFRIEQYVDMVLNYSRLDSDSSDLVVQEYKLDDIIKEVIRKYASQFILKKLKFSYVPTDIKVVTDRKWLSFIIEQLISNAIKYTAEGEVRIEVQGGRLSISDTGIGISAEDVPRIFEKGYTGNNGRIGQKSSGLGLFLSKKAADLIAVNLKCESKLGEGSTFSVIFPERL
ncbi:MAG: sensor histidine kinase [Clostridia bacterium]|nr:sensor histidine kinase [Clostridia bacterium]